MSSFEICGALSLACEGFWYIISVFFWLMVRPRSLPLELIEQLTEVHITRHQHNAVDHFFKSYFSSIILNSSAIYRDANNCLFKFSTFFGHHQSLIWKSHWLLMSMKILSTEPLSLWHCYAEHRHGFYTLGMCYCGSF